MNRPDASTDHFSLDGLSCVITDGVARVTLEKAPVNVLDGPLMHALIEALAGLDRNPALRLLVLQSSLKSFSAGVDVESHRGDSARPTIRLFHRLMQTIENFHAPTLAVVSGAAFGGGLELALACDLRVIAHEAKLGVPETTLGVFPPYAIVRLPELIGRGRTARYVLTGELLDGQEAHRLGLAEWSAPRADLERVVSGVVDALRSKSAATLRNTKQALHAGRPPHLLTAVEHIYLDQLMATADADEGLAAWIEKRDPVWTHA